MLLHPLPSSCRCEEGWWSSSGALRHVSRPKAKQSPLAKTFLCKIWMLPSGSPLTLNGATLFWSHTVHLYICAFVPRRFCSCAHRFIPTCVGNMVLDRFHFQYPVPDRHYWNIRQPTLPSMQTHAFSIHFWIDIVETLKVVLGDEIFKIFQYPLLDRYCWNWNRQELIHCIGLTFSIHFWIDIVETRPRTSSCAAASQLSVSTSGSILLKLEEERVRGLCERSFSIHCWIDIVETTRVSRHRQQQRIFQYPLLDRYCWNFSIYSARYVWGDFQYPLLDRYCWNHSTGSLTPTLFTLSVSTAGSILLKPEEDEYISEAPVSFQYPLLDRYCWNPPGFMLFTSGRSLSVSTAGSILLKPSAGTTTLSSLSCPSVSTAGSILLKQIHYVPICNMVAVLSVSTAGSILLKLYVSDRAAGADGTDFQYPLLDRYCWNGSSRRADAPG